MTKEKVQKWNEKFIEWDNFDENGCTWIAVGNTFPIKDELKKAGAKFNKELGWHFKEETTEFKVVPVMVYDVVEKLTDGRYTYKETVYDYIKSIQDKYVEHTNSNWVGTVGQMLNAFVTLKDVHQFNGAFGLTNVFTFKDEFDNSIVWITASAVNLKIGTSYSLRGTIKAHNEFRGDKQTMVSRCKCMEV